MPVDSEEDGTTVCKRDNICLLTAERVGLRWFNPREVKLCGHGSFATAAILFYRFGRTGNGHVFLSIATLSTIIIIYIIMCCMLVPCFLFQDILPWEIQLAIRRETSFNFVMTSQARNGFVTCKVRYGS